MKTSLLEPEDDGSKGFVIKLTDEEFRTIERMAAARGMSVSSFVNSLLGDNRFSPSNTVSSNPGVVLNWSSNPGVVFSWGG